MLPEIEELIRRPICHTITMKYHDYGGTIVECTVQPIYHKALSVQSIGGTEKDALSEALELLEKVKKIESLIKVPSLDEQKNIGGYCHKTIQNNEDIVEISFRRNHTNFVVTSIRKKDENGFYFCDPPYELPKTFFEASSDHRAFHYVKDLVLEDGESLWTWDTIRPLSGTMGFAIVKDGRVIKTKGILMS